MASRSPVLCDEQLNKLEYMNINSINMWGIVELKGILLAGNSVIIHDGLQIDCIMSSCQPIEQCNTDIIY